jgi:hypothetical protein
MNLRESVINTERGTMMGGSPDQKQNMYSKNMSGTAAFISAEAKKKIVEKKR